MSVRSYEPKAMQSLVVQMRKLVRDMPDGDLKDSFKSLLSTMEERSRAADQSAAEAYFNRVASETPQETGWDRNSWQRRLGALVTLIEAKCEEAKRDDMIVNPYDLLECTYRVVNTNPMSGSIDDPYADIAKLITRQTLEASLAAGLVVPGPNAPDWMKEES